MSAPGTTLVNLWQVVTDDPDGTAEIPEVVQDDPEGVEPLLVELMDDIIGRLPMLEVLQLRPYLGAAFRNVIHRPAFRRNRPRAEGEFSPASIMTDAEGGLHWHGFDTSKVREWTRLPSLNFALNILSPPEPNIFNFRVFGYLMAGDGGLLCINVRKASGGDNLLVICNPLTRTAKALPPLKYDRQPVLMHLKVDHDSGHYQVIVAGSGAKGAEELSLKTEEYDSKTGVWECPDGSDLPCPPFGLSDYQNGVLIKVDGNRELLMCVAVVDTRRTGGVLVYDTLKKKWAHVKQLNIPLVRSVDPDVLCYPATTQIVEYGGSVFVFSQQKGLAGVVDLVIHKLIPEGSGEFRWEAVMKRQRTETRGRLTGCRGLGVHPVFACVPLSEHRLCICSNVTHTVEIIDFAYSVGVTLLQYSAYPTRNRFYFLNPIGFVFKPSFKSVVSPRRDAETQCKAQSETEPVP